MFSFGSSQKLLGPEASIHYLESEGPFWFSLQEQMKEWTERSSGKDQDVQTSVVDLSMSSAVLTLPFCVLW